MIERVVRGEVPAKHHIALRSANGSLRWEECITRDGFDGGYTIAYHSHRPHEQRVAPTGHGWVRPEAAPGAVPSDPHGRPLAKRHYKSQDLAARGGPAIDARIPMMFNKDMVLSVSHPSEADPVYFSNGDADDLVFVVEGGGVLRTVLGDLRFDKWDYICVPRGIQHRWIPDREVEQTWLHLECLGGMGLLKQWRNPSGQLTMDAPYCHRDFRGPEFVGPLDEGIRTIVVKKHGRFHGFTQERSPLDVVGWDGAVWPFAFPILNFQPRAGLVHLPPTWHGTFATRGGLVCSFVPRVVDFHEQAIPCPYPHSSVDVDEFIYYVEGNFTSRKGVTSGSMSVHPAGLPHGPHPGAYEASIGTPRTDELAVMLDVFEPLIPTSAALSVEDPGYQDSFIKS